MKSKYYGIYHCKRTSDFIKGSASGPVLLKVFINYLDSEIKCIFSKFAGNTKLSTVVDTTEGKDDVQKDLDILHPWKESPWEPDERPNARCSTLVQSTDWENSFESSPLGKDLEVLVDKKLDTSQQCSLAAQEARQMSGWEQVEGGNFPLLCPSETPCGVWCSGLTSAAQEGRRDIGAGPEMATKMIREMKQLFCYPILFFNLKGSLFLLYTVWWKL